MKAKANLWYGSSRYPVHEDNEPEIDLEALKALLEPALRKMDENSGGHRLDRSPRIVLMAFGNGYDLKLDTQATSD